MTRQSLHLRPRTISNKQRSKRCDGTATTATAIGATVTGVIVVIGAGTAAATGGIAVVIGTAAIIGVGIDVAGVIVGAMCVVVAGMPGRAPLFS